MMWQVSDIIEAHFCGTLPNALSLQPIVHNYQIDVTSVHFQIFDLCRLIVLIKSTSMRLFSLTQH